VGWTCFGNISDLAEEVDQLCRYIARNVANQSN
jgi:hypothetical protein